MNNSIAVYASYLLAKALKDYFPKIQLVGGFAQAHHFSYDFIADFPIDDQALHFLNGRIKELMGSEVSSHEMLQGGALSLFKASGEWVWASQMKELDKRELVSLVRVGDKYLLGNGPIGSMKVAVKLLAAEKEGDIWRITGLAENDTAALKEKIKRTKAERPQESQLFRKIAGEIVFTPKGAAALRHFEEACAEVYKTQNFDFIKGPPGDFLKRHLAYGKKSAEVNVFFRNVPARETRGLWLSQYYHRDEGFYRVSRDECKEVLISSLQFIQKNANMFGIENLWLPTLPKRGMPSMPYEALMQNEEIFKIELEKGRVASKKFALFYDDAFMEPWEGPSLELMNVPNENVLLIKTSLFGSFERFIAFCLENNKALP